MGEKLKSLRIEKKLTQKQVADRIGLAISAVSSYESGTRYPSYDVLAKLARIFHVSTDYLLGKTDIRNPGEQIDNVLNEAMIGMSKKDYEKLT